MKLVLEDKNSSVSIYVDEINPWQWQFIFHLKEDSVKALPFKETRNVTTPHHTTNPAPESDLKLRVTDSSSPFITNILVQLNGSDGNNCVHSDDHFSPLSHSQLPSSEIIPTHPLQRIIDFSDQSAISLPSHLQWNFDLRTSEFLRHERLRIFQIWLCHASRQVISFVRDAVDTCLS